MNTQEAKRHLLSLPNNVRLIDKFLKLPLLQEQFKERVCNGKAHYEEDIRTGQLIWIKACNCGDK